MHFLKYSFLCTWEKPHNKRCPHSASCLDSKSDERALPSEESHFSRISPRTKVHPAALSLTFCFHLSSLFLPRLSTHRTLPRSLARWCNPFSACLFLSSSFSLYRTLPSGFRSLSCQSTARRWSSIGRALNWKGGWVGRTLCSSGNLRGDTITLGCSQSLVFVCVFT